MNKVSEDELRKLTEEKGFEYVGVLYTFGKSHNTNIQFICPRHRDKGVQSKLLANMRKSKGKCSYCSGHKRTHSDFINIMKDVNPNIDFLSEYKGATQNIKCKCLICGYEWNSIPNRLFYGVGCMECGKKTLSNTKTKTHDVFEKEILVSS